jgi:hypothetical protein
MTCRRLRQVLRVYPEFFLPPLGPPYFFEAQLQGSA